MVAQSSRADHMILEGCYISEVVGVVPTGDLMGVWTVSVIGPVGYDQN